jgi:predicted membrane protein
MRCGWKITWIRMMNNQPLATLENPEPKGLGWLRGLVFCTSLVVMMIIIAWPHVFGSTTTNMSHGAATISMCGMSFGFVYGIGFVPRSRLLRIIFSAPASLGLMVLGFLIS